MTPARVLALAARALGRPPSQLDLETWDETLACPPQTACPPADCVHDDEADTALRMHRATSNYPPTPADVRKIAVGLANARVEAAQMAEMATAAEHAVPPTQEYLDAKAEWNRQRALRQAELDAAAQSDVPAGSPS